MKNDDLNYIDIFEYRNENFDCILDNVKVCNVSLDSLENLCYNDEEEMDKYIFINAKIGKTSIRRVLSRR